MNSVFLTLALLWSATVSLPGQNEADDQARRATGKLAWFVATAIPQDLENPVSVLIGKDLTEVTLSKRSVSEPVKIPVDGIIKIVRQVPNPADPAKPAYLTLAQARIPEGMNKALIILIPAKKSESGLLYHCKVQTLAKFKGGDYLYLNLSPMNIAVQMGDTKIALKPGSTTIHEASSLTKSTNTPVSYHYFNAKQEKWRLLSASTIVMRPTRREICIFSWDPRFERVDYHGVTFPVTQ